MILFHTFPATIALSNLLENPYRTKEATVAPHRIFWNRCAMLDKIHGDICDAFQEIICNAAGGLPLKYEDVQNGRAIRGRLNGRNTSVNNASQKSTINPEYIWIVWIKTMY